MDNQKNKKIKQLLESYYECKLILRGNNFSKINIKENNLMDIRHFIYNIYDIILVFYMKIYMNKKHFLYLVIIMST